MSKASLYAPEEYWKLTPEDRKQLTNGCGTKGLGGVLVPDTVYGVRISDACNIHDFMYHEGKVIADKEAADRSFLNNMLRIVEIESSLNILKRLRARRVLFYYEVVRDFGGPAFWSGKNKPAEMGRLS